MKQRIRPDDPSRTNDPSQLPPERPNNLAIMVRFAVIAAAALLLVALAIKR